MAGFCDNVTVRIHADGSCTVEDNGRGIPVEMHKEAKTSALEVVLTKLHAGGKFDSESYKVAGGLHGVGVSVVNALSEWLEADVYRGGIHYHFECFRGARKGDVKKIGTTDKRGTKIAFKPDEEIFGDTEFDYDTILKRIREMAYLNGGLKISFRDDRADKKESFKFDDGIRAFVNHLNEGKEILHKDVIYLAREDTEARLGCEVAMQYNDGYTENVLVVGRPLAGYVFPLCLFSVFLLLCFFRSTSLSLLFCCCVFSTRLPSPCFFAALFFPLDFFLLSL